MAAENAALKKFLVARLYNNPVIVGDRERSVDALAQLFDFYVEHPEAMPKAYADLAQRGASYRVVCDYIAGMTDHFLLRQHSEMLGTSSVRSALGYELPIEYWFPEKQPESDRACFEASQTNREVPSLTSLSRDL